MTWKYRRGAFMLLAWILNGHWYQVDYVLIPHAHSYAYTNSHMAIAFVEKILGVPEFLCHFFGHPVKKKKRLYSLLQFIIRS